MRFQLGDAVASERRDEDRCRRTASIAPKACACSKQLLFHALINLVEHQQLALGSAAQRVQDRLQGHRRVSSFGHRPPAAPRPLLLAPSQAAATIARSSRRRGAKIPGVSASTIWTRASLSLGQRDPQQPGAGGLRLGRDDRHLLADQRVDQRRFARIGRADHRHDAAGVRFQPCSRSPKCLQKGFVRRRFRPLACCCRSRQPRPLP